MIIAFFFNNYLTEGTGQRLTGFQRYQELLSRDLKRFLTVNLLTLLGFLPFLLGTLLSILSSSVLVLIPACILGGMTAGPALACMHDTVLRSLRDAPGRCLDNYKRAFKQNWKQSLIPGILFCLLLGFYTFMLAAFLWASRFPGIGTLAVYLMGLLLVTMFFLGIWFPLFTADFLLYSSMDEVFCIEEQITQAFPEQTPFYESDEAWLNRKQGEH